MNGLLIEPVHVYDVQARARAQLFGWVRPLTQAQYTRPFPLGLGSIRETLVEIARSEHYYVLRLRERPIPRFDESYPIGPSLQPAFADLERVWEKQAAETRAALAEVPDWDRLVTSKVRVRWRSPLIWEPRASQESADQDGTWRVVTVSATKRDIVIQLFLHEVHHRAQAMAMLRQLGVPAMNLDYIEFARQQTQLTP